MKEPLSMPPCAGNRCAAIQMSGLKLYLIEIGIIEVRFNLNVHAVKYTQYTITGGQTD